MLMQQRGFTIIELLVVIVLLGAVGAVFFVQKAQYASMHRDEKRRTAINAMHYNLEDVFYLKNRFYPQSLDEKNLTAMDSALLTDPNGKKVGTSGSSYHYEPAGCERERCTGYTLRANLENEADFVKESRNTSGN